MIVRDGTARQAQYVLWNAAGFGAQWNVYPPDVGVKERIFELIGNGVQQTVAIKPGQPCAARQANRKRGGRGRAGRVATVQKV